MQFIEMPGKVLLELVTADEHRPEDLRALGVREDSLVRINLQGDIELRGHDSWEVIGGLIGDFEHRIKKATGRNWAE